MTRTPQEEGRCAGNLGAVDTGFSAGPLADAGCGSRSCSADDRRADHRARGFRPNGVLRGSTPLDVQRRQQPRRRRSGDGLLFMAVPPCR